MFKYYGALKNYKLKIVILDCPYDMYTTSEFTRNFLSDLFQLKLEGYQKHYPYGIMPISDYDFMATHVSICLSDKGQLIPLAAFKSITNKICQKFRVPFPVVGHKFGVHKEKFPNHVDALHLWQEQCEERGESFAYNASWTMRNELDKDLRGICREVSYSLLHFHYHQEKIENMINSTACIHNVNTNEDAMGFKILKDRNGNFLEPFCSPVFFEQPFHLMYFDKAGLSEVFIKECEKYKDLWDARMIINAESVINKLKVA
jgi:hypothetical protein